MPLLPRAGPCIPSVWLFLCCILYNKWVKYKHSVFLTSVSCSSKLSNLRKGSLEAPIYSRLVSRTGGNLGLAPGIWSEGSHVELSPSPVGSAPTPGKLFSELDWIVGHPVSVQRAGELVGLRETPTRLVSELLWVKTAQRNQLRDQGEKLSIGKSIIWALHQVAPKADNPWTSIMSCQWFLNFPKPVWIGFSVTCDPDFLTTRNGKPLKGLHMGYNVTLFLYLENESRQQE